MKLGIMQPYFFPYLGYWQLINAVDIFVIYDDVNFKKRSWISRNKILLDGLAKLFSIKLSKVNQNKLIKEMKLFDDDVYSNKLLKTIKQCYKKAPYYKDIIPLIEGIIKNDEKNLSEYLAYSIIQISRYLEIETKIFISSEIEKNNNLKGQDKILEICRIFLADHYINPIGGKDLYSKKDFLKFGVKLDFLEPMDLEYVQFNKKFIPNLSIIDVLMFNPLEEIKKILKKYNLI
jgi:hypothetical protein